MTTFQPIIVQCPVCKQKMYDYELSSYTVFESTLFSDGKSDPVYSNAVDSAIKICSKCELPFWVEHVSVNEEKRYELANELPKARRISDLPFMMEENFPEKLVKYYEKLLKSGFAGSRERKYFLRMHLWWAINDLVRYRPAILKMVMRLNNLRAIKYELRNRQIQHQLFSKFTKLFKENLVEMIASSKPVHDDERIMLAEMFRESGQFRKAREVLKQAADQNNHAVRKIRKKTFLLQKKVFRL